MEKEKKISEKIVLTPLPPLTTTIVTPPIKPNKYPFTLDIIYAMKDQDTALLEYRILIDDANAGSRFTYSRIIDELVEESHERGLLSDEDYHLHNSKHMNLIRKIGPNMINRLIQAYKVQIQVYRTPTALISGGQSPELNEWWQYLAFGASSKILEDRLDIDGLSKIRPLLEEQQRLVLRRTLVQQTSERTATIYTEQTQPSGNNNFNQFQ